MPEVTSKECTDDRGCRGLLNANFRGKTGAAIPKGRKRVAFHREAFLKEPVECKRLLLKGTHTNGYNDFQVAQMEQILEKVGSNRRSSL